MVPAWRGLSHELAIVPVAVFGIWVVVAADGLLASVALTTHAILLVAMLVISSIYHRHAHSLEAKLWARRADHAAIFGLIAASYTPICLLATTRWLGLPVLAVAWLVAARGAWLKLAHLQLGQDRFNSWDVRGSWLRRGDPHPLDDRQYGLVKGSVDSGRWPFLHPRRAGSDRQAT